MQANKVRRRLPQFMKALADVPREADGPWQAWMEAKKGLKGWRHGGGHAAAKAGVPATGPR